MKEIGAIKYRLEQGYTLTRYGSKDAMIVQLKNDTEYLLSKVENNEVLDLVMQSDYPPEYIRIACAEYYRKKTPLRAIKLVKKYTNMDIKTAKMYCDSHFA